MRLDCAAEWCPGVSANSAVHAMDCANSDRGDPVEPLFRRIDPVTRDLRPEVGRRLACLYQPCSQSSLLLRGSRPLLHWSHRRPGISQVTFWRWSFGMIPMYQSTAF